MTTDIRYRKIGEIRPSQMVFSYGVGAIVDLPNLSTMIMGLDSWDTAYCREIGEERLLAAVKEDLGDQVEKLLSPPEAPDSPTGFYQPFDASANVGIPVAPFPRWLLCPYCRRLAPVSSGLFELKVAPYRPDRTKYVHKNCSKPGAPPTAVPARFLVACEHGHLDDFPWITFVHRGPTDCRARLLLRELGVSGEAVDVEVFCEECGARRRMSDAFGPQAKDHMPQCRGRRPHLRDYEEDGCTEKMQTILLGASNSWFSLVQSALSIPAPGNRLAQLVTEHWPILEKAANLQNIGLLRQIGQLHAFAQYSDDEVWSAVEAKRSTTPTGQESHDLKSPEWRVLSNPDQANNTSDFYLREVPAPEEFKSVLEKIVLVERLREVRALVGFTRIESPGDFDEMIELPSEQRAPLSRRPPRWIPATEIRGEGIFVQFKEKQIHDWIRHTKGLDERERDFQEAHRRWRRARGLEVNAGGFPGLRYVLLHSFSHALMRQLALEAGYSMASLRERIYSAPPEAENGPMAGVLLYTAAPDSEGTLGGLVRLGEPLELGRHIGFALEEMRLCASDPLCAEHHPFRDGLTLHGAACHACLFAPETSCERGNKYLDRWLLVDTIASNGVAFFHTEG